METLYFQQTELAETIAKVLINFNKDSKQRKTIDYCKKKLDLLESYWKEYQLNNEKLMPFEKRGHKYFVNSEFERTMESYRAAKDAISEYYDELCHKAKQPGFSDLQENPSYQQATAVAGPSGGRALQQQDSSPPAASSSPRARAEESRGTYSKLDDMLRKQTINFKAFSRTVESIDVESLNDKWEFEDALRLLQTRWTAIDNSHWELMMELEEDGEYELSYTKHERTYNGLRKAISAKMWATSYRDKSTPKMEIPMFSGNYQQWVSFKDLFNEAIHNNPSLSKAQKMQFLKGKVKGEAERLIQHLPISADNYDTCWEILTHRFNNKRQIFMAHVNSFYNLATIQQQSYTAIKRLHDVTLESLHAIKNLGVDIMTWDPLLVYILSQKLDSDSYSEYIESLKNSRELPVLQDFLDFLENKFTALESSRRRQDGTPKTVSSQSSNPSANSHRKNNYKSNNEFKSSQKLEFSKSMHVSEFANKCPHCSSKHNLINCKKFLESPNEQKIKIVKQLNYCINCVYDHNGAKCYSTKRCHKCNKEHHTILHDCFATQSESNSLTEIAKEKCDSNKSIHASQQEASEILLATALVKVTAADQTQHVMRALIDQGSQVSVISEKAAQQLGLKRRLCKGVIFGVGERENNCKGKLTIVCQSTYTDFKFSTDVLIMNSLIKNLPNDTFTKPSWQHTAHLCLADPDYNISRPVDLLLGAEVYANILLEGLIRGQTSSEPLAQQTHLGWLLCGGNINTSFQCNVILNNVQDIQQFWQIEDIQEQNSMSVEDQECLDFYETTTERLGNGRYVVRLPMKPEFEQKLGSSKEIAIAQFKNLERKLIKNYDLENKYKQFIHEYEQMQHMKLATCKSKQKAELECFLPHHAVQRAESTTTKLRVVFNASSKTSSGYSLNDLMYRGPNLQLDLLELILRWRQYRFAFTADIEKCFRMILVDEQDQSLQQIVWRQSPDQPIRSYKLATITYGTKAAPFLTMMTLRKLASDEQQKYPEAVKCIQEELYMDDWVSGAHSIEEGKQRITEVNACLKSGGFSLRKWSSNNRRLLETVEQAIDKQPAVFTFKTESSSKTLGLQWNAIEDEFIFKFASNSTETAKLTKRLLLSEISKIFDPLGWLAPLTTKMKILFQQVWQDSEVQWSDEVSNKIKEDWINLKKDLILLNQFKIPRWIQSKKDDVIELHGFCDASVRAFGCVVYARLVSNHSTSMMLVAAKTRLVPSSKAVSIPRLELCAAELLTKLMTKISKSINSLTVVTYGWSDSKVTLSWIQGSPERWKPFVANRVKKITSVMPPNTWHYINTKENPADAASRGLTTSQLLEHALWWQGPTFLSSALFKPKDQTTYTTDEETKKYVNLAQNLIANSSIVDDLLHRYSSFTKITRILAWIRRALTPVVSKQKENYLTLHELRSAKVIIIKYVQRAEFNSDVGHLLQNQEVKSDSKLLNLNPYLDQEGILRAKGRLRHANISSEMKYPIIIPYSSRLTELLISQAHELTFHGGARLTMSFLRHKYWISKGNRAVKTQLNRCVICRKQEPRKLQQIMGDLPDFRTNPAPAFYHTGVDYTGFISVKANKGRGIKTTKGYVALFICMVTKAVHIELVSDLSSASFIAALRRMSARRGAPKHMYSDNGTNFVGANTIMQEEYQQIEQVFGDSFYKEIAEMDIEWHWNCPSWPSAGGLWERSIRSLKQHLKRVVADQALTFEEYSTILAQIEAGLNSRPLCPISEDIDDLDFLTPAHFLSGRAGLTVIETANDARTRWHLTNKIFQDLWRRWKTEYLSQLSVRSKWLKTKSNIKIGNMVTIHDDNFPSGKWPVGRVVEVHRGNDGFVRVVTLKTKTGLIKRPIIKLSVLPIEQNDEEKADEEQRKKVKPKVTAASQANIIKPRNFVNVVLSLIFFMSILCSSEASNHITQFSGNQSLYYDPLGKLNLIRDQWKIVSYYNMQPYFQGNRAVDTFINYLEQTCKQIKEPSHCNLISLQVQHDYSELQYHNQLLLNQHFSTRSRTRRGLVNAVGSIANTLFGVLDQSFADKYQRDIENINSNEKHLLQLWKNQTSVVEAEYNVLKRTEKTIDTQYKLINKHLNLLEEAAKEVQMQSKSTSILQEFTLAAIATTNMIQNLKRVQDTLIDTLADIYHSKINMHLLTPEQLSKELQIISGQISKELTLPINNIQSDLYQIYKLLKIKARLSKEYFIFEIAVPLISRDSFQLYRLIPVPVQVGNDMISIIPITNYVATNLMRDSYVEVRDEDLQTCVHQEESYICQLRGPIKRLEPEEKFCLTEKIDICQPKKETCKNMWLQLHDLSSYLYFACDTYSLTIICDNDNETRARRVSKAGLIQLDKECIAKGRDITLYSYQQENKLTLKPDLLLANIAPIQHHHLANITLTLLETTTDDAQINSTLTSLGKQIAYMKAAALEEGTITVHDVHHYAISYVLLAAIVAAFLWFLWRRCRRASPAPARGPQAPCEPMAAPAPVGETGATPLSSASVSASARKSPVPQQVFGARGTKRWSSLRDKKDNSTSPIRRQSVFTVDTN